MANNKLIDAVCCFLAPGKYLAKPARVQEQEKMHGRKWPARHIGDEVSWG